MTSVLESKPLSSYDDDSRLSLALHRFMNPYFSIVTIKMDDNYVMILVEFDGICSFAFVLDSKIHSKQMVNAILI